MDLWICESVSGRMDNGIDGRFCGTFGARLREGHIYGMARYSIWCSTRDSHLASHVSLPPSSASSAGYVDPLYWRNNQLTEKSDVYSFGVVLLEIVTGKNAIWREERREKRGGEVDLATHPFGEEEEEQDHSNLVEWVKPLTLPLLGWAGLGWAGWSQRLLVRKWRSTDSGSVRVPLVRNLGILSMK